MENKFISENPNLNKKIKIMKDIYIQKNILLNQIVVFKSKKDEFNIAYVNNKKILVIYNVITKEEKILEQVLDKTFIYFTLKYYQDSNEKEILLIVEGIPGKSKFFIYDLNLGINLFEYDDMENKSIGQFYGIFMDILPNKYVFINIYKKLYTYRFNNKLVSSKILEDYPGFLGNYINSYNGNSYIILGLFGRTIVYNSEDLSIYKKFQNNNEEDMMNNGEHFHEVVREINKEKIELIESDARFCAFGGVRVWNFLNGDLLQHIKTPYGLYGFCIYKEKYLIIGGRENSIQIIDLNQSKIITKLKNIHKNVVLSVDKIEIPNLGNYIITLGLDKTIFVWKI